MGLKPLVPSSRKDYLGVTQDRKISMRRVVVQAINPSTRGQRLADLCGFKASLVCRGSSRTAKAVIWMKLQVGNNVRMRSMEEQAGQQDRRELTLSRIYNA